MELPKLPKGQKCSGVDRAAALAKIAKKLDGLFYDCATLCLPSADATPQRWI
jgi:hypothetical protein